MRRGARAALLFFALALAAVLMNYAAGFVDGGRMRENARQGAAMLCEQGATPELTGGFKTSQADNYTSVLILKTAAYTGAEPPLWRALGGYRTDLRPAEGEDAWAAFCRVADGRESPTGGLSYSRYWHGYTLPLRLLLSVFNLANIQMLLLFCQYALTGACLLLLEKRGLSRFAPALLAALFLMMPPATGLCLQYAPVSLLSLSACCLLLLARARIARAVSLPAFFAAVGVLTCYFDLMTFPTVTLAFPLALEIALRGKERRAFLHAAACAAAWGAGFALMWAFKWGLNALVFGPAYAAGVKSQIALRISSASGGARFTRLQALGQNLALVLAKPAYLAALAASAAACLACGLRSRARTDASALFALLVPLLAPVLWMLLTANHVYDHDYYTYRNLAGAAFAALSALTAAGGLRRT